MISLEPNQEKLLLSDGYDLVVGIDEVGRGCWAGPLYFAAYIYSGGESVPNIQDSKKLSKLKREKLYPELSKHQYQIQIITVEKINDKGLGSAMNEGLKEFINQLKLNYKSKRIKFLIDGYFKDLRNVDIDLIIDGDAKIYSIAAASILAKVERDNYMARIALDYPNYGFEKHVGYGTKIHQEALTKLGVTKIHRTGYKPIQKIVSL